MAFTCLKQNQNVMTPSDFAKQHNGTSPFDCQFVVSLKYGLDISWLSQHSFQRIFVSLPVCILSCTRSSSTECRKRSLLGDSFSLGYMEIFSVIEKTSCSSLELYLLSFSAHGGTSSNVLGPFPLLFHKTLSKDEQIWLT